MLNDNTPDDLTIGDSTGYNPADVGPGSADEDEEDKQSTEETPIVPQVSGGKTPNQR